MIRALVQRETLFAAHSTYVYLPADVVTIVDRWSCGGTARGTVLDYRSRLFDKRRSAAIEVSPVQLRICKEDANWWSGRRKPDNSQSQRMEMFITRFER